MVTKDINNDNIVIIALNCKEKSGCKTISKQKSEQKNFLGRRYYNAETVKKSGNKYEEFQYDGEEGYFVKKAYRY
jgi:hypothetical protein